MRHEIVQIVDPEPWMCTANGCPAIIGNYLVYRDQSHVSTSYATYLTPLIATVLTRACPGGRSC